MFRPRPTEVEFHRRRAESELEKALVADCPETSLRHLQLAKLHYRRRSAAASNRFMPGRPAPIMRTDKEA